MNRSVATNTEPAGSETQRQTSSKSPNTFLTRSVQSVYFMTVSIPGTSAAPGSGAKIPNSPCPPTTSCPPSHSTDRTTVRLGRGSSCQVAPSNNSTPMLFATATQPRASASMSACCNPPPVRLLGKCITGGEPVVRRWPQTFRDSPHPVASMKKTAQEQIRRNPTALWWRVNRMVVVPKLRKPHDINIFLTG